MTRVITSGSTATGTVTSFSAGNLSPLFTTSVANPTTTPALSFALSNANAGTIFAGPTTGAAAAPTFATSASLSGALTLGSTSPITGPILGIPVAVTGSANYGEISLGASPFDGVTAGFFVGNANGTHIAINAGSGYLGRMLDAQIAGVRMFAVGLGTVASATSAVLNSISAPAFTVTVSGNTAITTSTGFNYAELGIPTYSAASALTITNAATLAIRGAPAGGGAGPATITNAYALWVEGGTSRFDSTISLSTDVLLNRVNANILGLYNSTNANEFQVYGTRTDASNYERFVIRTAAGTYTVGAEAAGGTLRGINFVGSTFTLSAPTTITAGSLASTVPALTITGTLNSANANQTGVNLQLTTSGSNSIVQYGINVDLLAGWTGSGGAAVALRGHTSTVGTASGIISGVGNIGFVGNSDGVTTGSNVGGISFASNGTKSVGYAGIAITAKNSGINVGVFGAALNTGSSPTQVGGFFGLMNTDPTFASAALIADNGSTSSPVFLARVNGTTAFQVGATGCAVTAASTTTIAGLNLPHGAAPTSPVDGDMWTTSAGGLFVRINGVTKTVTLT